MVDEIKKNKNKESVSGKKIVKYEFNKFKKSIKSTDGEVTMILRAHLLAEYYLNRLIEIELPCGYFITKEKLSFYNKIAIVKALDVLTEKKGIESSLYELNSLRNRCAHVINYIISEDDVDRIGLPLGQRYTQSKFNFLKDVKGLLYKTLFELLAINLSFIVNINNLIYRFP